MGEARDGRPPPDGLPSSMPDGPWRYTPLGDGGRGRPAGRGRSRRRGPAARRPAALGSSTTRAPLRGIHAERPDGLDAPSWPLEVGRRDRSSAGARSSRRRRSGRRGAPRPGPRAGPRNASSSADRSIGRPPEASRSEVIVPTSSGGKSAGAQSALMPRPTTTRGSVRPEAVGLAEDAGELADAAAVRALDDEVVRPLEADRPGRPGRRPPRRRRPSPALRVAARRQTRRARASRAGSRATAAAPRRPARSSVRPSRPRPAVCSSATARQTSGVPSASQSRTTSFVEPTLAKRSWRARNGVIAAARRAAVIRPPRCRRLRVARARRRRAGRAGRSRARPRR